MSNSRKYWGLESGKICLCTLDMDDRDLLVLGAVPIDRDEGKITSINRLRRVIRRAGNENEIPFPDKFYTESDINEMNWQVCRIGVNKKSGHESH